MRRFTLKLDCCAVVSLHTSAAFPYTQSLIINSWEFFCARFTPFCVLYCYAAFIYSRNNKSLRRAYLDAEHKGRKIKFIEIFLGTKSFTGKKQVKNGSKCETTKVNTVWFGSSIRYRCTLYGEWDWQMYLTRNIFKSSCVTSKVKWGNLFYLDDETQTLKVFIAEVDFGFRGTLYSEVEMLVAG